jgi:hypothetical protein
MGDKEVSKEESHTVSGAKLAEKEVMVLLEKKHEVGKSSAHGEARGHKVLNKPYSHHCLSKGHVKEECVTPLAYDICASLSHLKPRCPLQKKASKLFVMTCGYAVDGLGFYFIPHQAVSKPKGDSNTAIIRVTKGVLTGEEGIQLDRLVPGNAKWVVQEVDKNTFRTNFQSKGELSCMIEWGMVQTKGKLVKMVIEEGNGGSYFKQALRKVWVQMTRLPRELREYLTIWAIGMIIGVTKDVGMTFTCEFDRARFQVLVLDPSLIPHSIDMVIGEYIYELHFREERDDMIHLVPIDMDDDTMDDREEEGNGGSNEPKQVQQDQQTLRKSSSDTSAGDAGMGSKQQLGKIIPVHIPAQEEVQGIVHGAEIEGEQVLSGDEAPHSDPSSPNMQVMLLAAIPEAETAGRRSKRRAETADESSME